MLIGFLSGGVAYYTIYEVLSPPRQVLYSPPHIPEKVFDTSKAFSDIVASVSPAVINISTTKTVKRDNNPSRRDPFFDLFNPFHNMPKKWKEQSLGSGVIVSEDGYIVTNNHVIEQADEIMVTLYDQRSFKARIVGVDPKSDLALIKISESGLPTIPWSDSDKLRVGEFVLAIGNAFGLSHTVTMGIVSAVGRANVGIADYEDFIQTDAAINPGNSGGPLVNIQGELIGINTAIFSRSGGYQGIGFAVPVNMVRLVIDQLRKDGRVVRGWLGITIQDLTPELTRSFGLSTVSGALVSDVFKGSPAEKAGLRRGDVIIDIDGKPVKNVSALRNQVAQSRVGSELSVMIVRRGAEKRLKVMVTEMPKEFTEVSSIREEEQQPELSTLGGLYVTELTGPIAKQLGISPSERGVVVTEVEVGSPAQEAGVKKGDIIQEINRERVTSLDNWKRMISGISGSDVVVMFVNRGERKFYIALKP